MICKLLERLIKNHMVDFLVRHKLLNQSQHGFLKGRSCLTNMLCFLKEITKWIDEGSPLDIIYLNFQKAFDKVPHQRLLLKLKVHGIGDGIIDWIKQWLIDSRWVSFNLEISFEWGTTRISIRTLLFLICICDLDENIIRYVLKFADGDKQHLQNYLNKFVLRSEKWHIITFWEM